ncbi:MAG TPA: SDR family oxidoreductase [Prosthecobacter sp.]
MKTDTANQTDKKLKIVVIGGTGLIGKQVVTTLQSLGHETIAASPSTSVNTLTGAGLAEAFAGTDVVVDVANSPSFEDGPVMAFFDTAGRNIAQAEQAAGVKHHVALSVVGTDRLQASGYFRAKLVQEKHIQESSIPYTIVRATQFYEFVSAIAHVSAVGDTLRPSTALFQPIAAADVAAAVAEAALAAPQNGIVEVAGPERITLASAVREYVRSNGDAREVVDDPTATYFGTPVDDSSLTAGPGARLGATRFSAWLAQSAATR